MPLTRMTTRRWMIAVAIVACLIQAERTRKHWSYCVSRAQQHRMLVDAYRQMRAVERDRMPPETFRSIEPELHRLEAANLAQQQAWERAARRAWIPFAPDLP